MDRALFFEPRPQDFPKSRSASQKFRNGAGRGQKYIVLWRDTKKRQHCIYVCGAMQAVGASNPVRDAFVQWSMENRGKWTLLCDADAWYNTFLEWYDCDETLKNILTVNEQGIDKVIVLLKEQVGHPGVGKAAGEFIGKLQQLFDQGCDIHTPFTCRGGRDPLYGNACLFDR